MALTPDEIGRILDVLQESDWDQAEVLVGDVAISVARNGSSLPDSRYPASVPAARAAVRAVVADEAGRSEISATPSNDAVPQPLPQTLLSQAHSVTSPSVGLFWRSPQPGAPPFVEVGQRVAAGDVLGIVEIMKLMNQVISGVAGTIAAIHVANAAPVEYGEALMTIVVS